MEYNEARERFIQAWGVLGSNWGINRTMAQIHALLLIAPEALTTEEIMEELNISRGNANMNTRALIDWGIVRKEHKQGERKEYFTSEKDIWHLAVQVTRERRRRELDPLLRTLEQLKEVDGDDKVSIKEFNKVTTDISKFAAKADKVLDKVSRADENWFFSSFLKFVR